MPRSRYTAFPYFRTPTTAPFVAVGQCIPHHLCCCFPVYSSSGCVLLLTLRNHHSKWMTLRRWSLCLNTTSSNATKSSRKERVAENEKRACGSIQKVYAKTEKNHCPTTLACKPSTVQPHCPRPPCRRRHPKPNAISSVPSPPYPSKNPWTWPTKHRPNKNTN